MKSFSPKLDTILITLGILLGVGVLFLLIAVDKPDSEPEKISDDLSIKRWVGDSADCYILSSKTDRVVGFSCLPQTKEK